MLNKRWLFKVEGHVDSNISVTRNNMQDKSIYQNKQ